MPCPITVSRQAATTFCVSVPFLYPKRQETSEVFKEEHEVAPVWINDRMQYVPWGADNQMPFNIIDLIESDETLATCQMFNAEVCFGSGQIHILYKDIFCAYSVFMYFCNEKYFM